MSKEERQAWDMYAAAWIAGQSSRAAYYPHIDAAQVADQMLAERRKRTHTGHPYRDAAVDE